MTGEGMEGIILKGTEDIDELNPLKRTQPAAHLPMGRRLGAPNLGRPFQSLVTHGWPCPITLNFADVIFHLLISFGNEPTTP